MGQITPDIIGLILQSEHHWDGITIQSPGGGDPRHGKVVMVFVGSSPMHRRSADRLAADIPQFSTVSLGKTIIIN